MTLINGNIPRHSRFNPKYFFVNFFQDESFSKYPPSQICFPIKSSEYSHSKKIIEYEEFKSFALLW
jgi:hypothetical protein